MISRFQILHEPKYKMRDDDDDERDESNDDDNGDDGRLTNNIGSMTLWSSIV